jgi:putative adhesin
MLRVLRYALFAGATLGAAHSIEAAAQTANPHRVAVPLSDPSRPATVKVGLLTGGITVTGWTGKEVVVDGRPRDEESDEDHERDKDDDRSKGLRKVNYLGSGLSIEENDNVVEISAGSWNRSQDVTLQVPIGTSLELQTVNDGDIVVRDVQGEVSAENTNGDVTVTGISGSAVIHALNGEVVARFVRLDGKRPSSFSSMNGNIDLTLPANAKAELRVKSDNGEIYTDFDVQWGTRAEAENSDNSESKDRKTEHKKGNYSLSTTMVGLLNGGGTSIRIQSFNGNIYIRKAK